MSDAGIDPAQLLARLDAIGGALRDSGHALALLGLGSVGVDRDRLDRQSDLDFFAIVEPGHKTRYLGDLDWLAAAHPIVWHYRNTADGFKALMSDGVFCEFAVFEPHELRSIPFAPGRVVWKRADVDDSIAVPARALPVDSVADEQWIVGEALGLLFVGMQRWRRGEKLSAARLVQVHAVDRLIDLDDLRARQRGESASADRDPFSRERRLERSRPPLAGEFAALMPGYDATPQAVRAIVAAFERRGAQLSPAVLERL
jgi:hypothetical protein